MPTPLHDALLAGDTAAAIALIAHSPAIRAYDNHGRTPLMLAAAGGDLVVLSALLDASVKVNACDPGDGTQARQIAAIARQRDTIGLDPEDVEQQVLAQCPPPLHLGRTALHYAARHGQHGATELLLERGARRESLDHLGYTALTLAIERDDVDMVTLLVEGRGRRATPLSIEAASIERAARGRALIMEALLRGSVTPRAHEARLAYAASALDEHLVDRLLEAGVSPDASARGGRTALMESVTSSLARDLDANASTALPALRPHELVRRRVCIAQRLLDAGADPTRQRRDGETARSLAQATDVPTELRAMLDKHASAA